MTRLAYLFDPLCGWCYGAAPALGKLFASRAFEIELAPTGLFSGAGARPMDDGFAAYAWANDQKIQSMTGQRFSEAYRRDVLADRNRPFDSTQATLAIVAVAFTAPGREFDALKAIQRARYVDGLDITDVGVLKEVLRGLALATAADRLDDPDSALISAFRERIDATSAEMQRFGVNGVPALILGDIGAGRLIKTNALFGDIDGLIAALQLG